LRDSGCDVIADDVTYITEPFMLDGVIAQAANEVTGNGVAYFAADGNFGNKSYSANFNNAKSSVQGQADNNYVNQAAGIEFNLLSKNGWFIQNDLTNQIYSGLSSGLNQNYWLWNAALGKKFLKNKKGELKLSVFDLLKQNQSIMRTVQPNYIEDTQTKVLQQYFMLTFTYSLKNFGTPTPSAPMRRQRPGF